MKISAVLLFLFCISQAANLFGGTVSIVSPDHPRTFEYGSTTRYVLLWDKRVNELVANISFTNSPYVSGRGYSQRVDEIYNFRFPGTTIGADGVVYAHGAPVAILSDGIHATPTVGSRIRVTKAPGGVHVVLTASTSAPAAPGGRSNWDISGIVSPD